MLMFTSKVYAALTVNKYSMHTRHVTQWLYKRTSQQAGTPLAGGIGAASDGCIAV